MAEANPPSGVPAADDPTEEGRIARERLTQVFKYLEALNQLRNPVQRQIKEQPWVLSLRELPDHPSVSRATVTSVEGDASPTATSGALLRVRRPLVTKAPQPPPEIYDWLMAGWEDPNGTAAIQETRNERNERGETIVTRFDGEAARKVALERWKREWESWAVNERPARAAMNIFERLYELHGRIQREAERIELLVGDGVLSWRREDGAVHHPILLLRVQLEFDPAVPEFRIIEADREPELYSSLFRSMPEIDGRAVARLKSELDAGGFHPLGGADTSGFLKALAVQLSPRGRFEDAGAAPSADAELAVRRDPSIFLRPRTVGFATAVEGVLEDLKSRLDLPESLRHIVGIESPAEASLSDEGPDGSTSRDDREVDVLLSKPANAEQLRIAQRLERHGSVLVQGPPGTGKTHTIANLVGHLLANGRTVLVTAHTTKALRVLRDHVVEQLRPLCVAVLESDTESRRQLEGAVDSIVQNLSAADVSVLESEARALAETRLRLRTAIAATQRELVAARNDEFRDVLVGGKAFAPSEAARRVAEDGHRTWIPGDVRPGVPLPLSDAEVRELYSTNALVSVRDEEEIRVGLPEPNSLVSPDAFATLADERAELTSADRFSGSEYWQERVVNEAGVLEQISQRTRDSVGPLGANEQWKLAAVEAGSEGEAARQPWEALCDTVESVLDDSIRARSPLVRYAPMLAGTIPVAEQIKVLGEIISHLDDGGSLTTFTLMRRRAWKQLIGGARVNDGKPSTREHFEALHTTAKLEQSRFELCVRWDRHLAALDAPHTAALGQEPERVCAQYTPVIHEHLAWHESVWLPTERALRDAGFDWTRFLARQPAVSGIYAAIQRLRGAVLGPLQSVLAARANALRWSHIDAEVTRLQQQLRRFETAKSSGHVVERLVNSVVQLTLM